jgi:hypothetical protein
MARTAKAHFVVNTTGVRAKYGSAGSRVLQSIQSLGPVLDVSGQTPDQIRTAIAALPAKEAACLVGGYDLIPPFVRANPTHGDSDDDVHVPTDAPYGATPGKAAEEYAPSRAVSRLPDGATADAAAFLATLDHQLDAPSAVTPKGSFEEAAKEFQGALKFVRQSIPGASGTQRLSPPADQKTAGLTGAISQHGRIHVLLHGANYDPDWAYLWGHDGAPKSPFLKSLSARILDLCDLRGAVVTFSSCYAAMLDVEPATSGARTPDNQVALACLAHGAKVVFGSTRSNWIAVQAPFDGYGPALVAEVWKELGKGTPAAEALRKAKRAYLKTVLSGDPGDRPYALKTVLQAQCYGHPAATL